MSPHDRLLPLFATQPALRLMKAERRCVVCGLALLGKGLRHDGKCGPCRMATWPKPAA